MRFFRIAKEKFLFFMSVFSFFLSWNSFYYFRIHTLCGSCQDYNSWFDSLKGLLDPFAIVVRGVVCPPTCYEKDTPHPIYASFFYLGLVFLTLFFWISSAGWLLARRKLVRGVVSLIYFTLAFLVSLFCFSIVFLSLILAWAAIKGV